ncbi:MAG: regulatory iron-sulfur-containing complex subunit RicT [Victivallaceae bacterium]|nr:regulatory iron-sulfur-containing complex subunit RicT [Victivallaceae bacterium]
MDIIYTIKLDNGATYLAKADDNLTFKEGDWCVIHKDFYNDYGQIAEAGEENAYDKKLKDVPRIIRKATVHDKSMAHENEMRGNSALRTTQEAVDKLKLEMKLLNVHFSLDKKLIIIQFTAEGRIDFRQLVKDLAKIFNARIELRQIGVRDETALKGGIGICGQQLCCNRFLKDFASINVRMAKDQDLSLTPSTISGFCGRLKCCLKYEHKGYLELEKTMPRRGDMCDCPGGRGKICDRNLLTQEVTVVLDDSGASIRCACSEVQVVYPDKYKIKTPAAAEEEELEEQPDEGTVIFSEPDELEEKVEKSENKGKGRRRKRRSKKHSKK